MIIEYFSKCHRIVKSFAVSFLQEYDMFVHIGLVPALKYYIKTCIQIGLIHAGFNWIFHF